MTGHQASRAEHQPGGGMAAVERDVIAVPRDKDAKRLVEDMQRASTFQSSTSLFELQVALGVVQGLAERLAVLLGERDAAAADGQKALGALLSVIDESVGVEGWHLNGAVAEWGEFEWIDDLRALARVKRNS